MAAKPRVTPRKQPVQERSKAMVQALLDATARVLVKDGYDALSTNRVAAAAGVSVGSLYQYFPSKESLVLGVMDRWAQQMMASMVQLSEELEAASLLDGVPAIVKAALDASRRDVPLHRALLQQVPRVGALDGLEQLNRRLADLLGAWLELHRKELGVDDPSLAAHVVVQVLVRLTDNALLHRPELLRSPAFEAQLERLVLRYLSPG